MMITAAIIWLLNTVRRRSWSRAPVSDEIAIGEYSSDSHTMKKTMLILSSQWEEGGFFKNNDDIGEENNETWGGEIAKMLVTNWLKNESGDFEGSARVVQSAVIGTFVDG